MRLGVARTATFGEQVSLTCKDRLLNIRIGFWIFVALIAGTLGTVAEPVCGQVQNLVTLPTMNLNDSFYESYGVGWSVNRMGPNGGFFFNNPGGAVAPAFGGFDPNAGATFGVGTNNARFNFSAAQGSNRTIVSEAPMVMVPNGGGGSFFSGTQRPFVTGIVPVVGGGGPTLINPLHLKLQQMRQRGESLRPSVSDDSERSAPRSAVSPKSVEGEEAPLVITRSTLQKVTSSAATAPRGSLSALRKAREAELAQQREQARQKILSAREAESEGRFALARSEFQVALRLVEKDDPWRPKIIECLRALAAKANSSTPAKKHSP